MSEVIEHFWFDDCSSVVDVALSHSAVGAGTFYCCTILTKLPSYATLLAKPILRAGVVTGAVVTVAVVTTTALTRWGNTYPWVRERVWSALVRRMRTLLNVGFRAQMQRAIELFSHGVRDGHPHPTAATARNSATTSMIRAVESLGRVPYVVSPSMREQQCDADRQYYQLNDFQQESRHDEITSRHVIIMTDIDYYVDWRYWMSFGVPILIYTFVPTTAGGPVEDGIFSIQDDVFTTMISGGGRYQHQVWDYNFDSVFVPVVPVSLIGRIGWFLGRWVFGWAEPTAMLVSIDHWNVTPSRRIISLVPFCKTPSIVVGDIGQKLERMKVSVKAGDGYNVLRVLSGAQSLVSVSRANEPFSITIPESLFIGTKIRYKTSKNRMLSDVVRFLGKESTISEAAVLADYLANTEKSPQVTVHQPGEFAAHYLCLGTDKAEEGKQYARRFANKPLTVEAVYPVDRSYNNEDVCIVKRIELPQRESQRLIKSSNPRAKSQPAARFASYADEFVKLVVQAPANGKPLAVTDVVDEQNLPRQRLRSSQRVADWSEPMVVKAFQKREPYTVANDPRNISSVPTMHTLRLSSFTMAFKQDCLKQCPWYMPGKTPLEIASAIMDFAQRNDVMIEGDYSRFDGTISRWLRVHVEFACYLRWVGEEDYQELSQLLVSELDPKAFTSLGQSYVPGCSRLSGSPLTTDGNTLINAFVAFATLREHGCDPGYAFDECGLFYGDDSLISCRAIGKRGLQDLTRVAGVVGLALKAAERPRGLPVVFLSRVFVDPWTTLDSHAEPLRAMAKIHTTIDRSGDVAMAGFHKTSAYLVTDSKTPFISDWCQCYQRCLGKQFDLDTIDTDTRDLPYWYVLPEHRAAPWPQTGIDSPEVVGKIAEALGVLGCDLEKHIERLRRYNGPVMGMPVLEIESLEPKVSAVVDGELFTVGDSSVEVTITKTRSDASSDTSNDGGLVPGVGKSRGNNQRSRGSGRTLPSAFGSRASSNQRSQQHNRWIPSDSRAPVESVRPSRSESAAGPRDGRPPSANSENGAVRSGGRPPRRCGPNRGGWRGGGRGKTGVS